MNPNAQQSVSTFLVAAPDPEKQGLGAVFPRVTHMSGGREIGIKLFTERLLVSRAIGKSDQLGLRFIASLLLVEFFVQSPWSNSKEISAIRDALLTRLGGPWPFNANWSFLSGELARNELTAGLEKTGVFSGAKTVAAPWFRLECDLPTASTIWQWNPALNRKSNGSKYEEDGLTLEKD
jgi:hypothetical protein